mmetsp:Transcript_15221/g.36020  ORF Transcript_15221/g.36020 Transcript_15221/m.36020 type:complete len:320 (+) Transcript_15221:82-1041(+)
MDFCDGQVRLAEVLNGRASDVFVNSGIFAPIFLVLRTGQPDSGATLVVGLHHLLNRNTHHQVNHIDAGLGGLGALEVSERAAPVAETCPEDAADGGFCLRVRLALISRNRRFQGGCPIFRGGLVGMAGKDFLAILLDRFNCKGLLKLVHKEGVHHVLGSRDVQARLGLGPVDHGFRDQRQTGIQRLRLLHEAGRLGIDGIVNDVGNKPVGNPSSVPRHVESSRRGGRAVGFGRKLLRLRCDQTRRHVVSQHHRIAQRVLHHQGYHLLGGLLLQLLWTSRLCLGVLEVHLTNHDLGALLRRLLQQRAFFLSWRLFSKALA